MPTLREMVISTGDQSVSALYRRPRGAQALFVLAHGAGAGMRHAFLESIAEVLAAHKIATLRYQFPYMEGRTAQKRSPPNRPPVLHATVRAAVKTGRRLARGLPLIAGGKSMGGRMTSQAAAIEPLPGVAGLAFLGFPLHPPKRHDKAHERAEHLPDVTVPMLFVQGTRDALAEMGRMRRVVRRLGAPATLHSVRGADHGFDVLVRSGRKSEDVLTEIAETIATWVSGLR